MQAGGGACLAGPGLDKITDLVDQPQAITARPLIGRGPVPDERIVNLAGVSYLADESVFAPPGLHRRAVATQAGSLPADEADVAVWARC